MNANDLHGPVAKLRVNAQACSGRWRGVRKQSYAALPPRKRSRNFVRRLASTDPNHPLDLGGYHPSSKVDAISSALLHVSRVIGQSPDAQGFLYHQKTFPPPHE